MFTKEENEKESKYRVAVIFYVLADSENAAMDKVSKHRTVDDADEKRITKMRRS
jgi:hypothetical protein